MKKTIFLIGSLLFAKNINYIQNNLHTLTQTSKRITLNISYLKINKSLDIFHLRDKVNSSFSSLGDLDGFELDAFYGINSNLMSYINFTKQNIDFLESTATNNRIDLFLRYHLVESNSFNNGISIDIGYVTNKLEDFKNKNIKAMNYLIKRFFPNSNISIIYSDGKELSKGYYIKKDDTLLKLKNTPYMGLKDTQDKSFYVRLLTGVNTSYNILDFFIGAKRSKITSQTATTDEIINLANKRNYNLIKHFDRYENSIFFGISNSFLYKRWIVEFNYQYTKLFRKKELSYINYNHILNANISYKLADNLYLNIGGKAMYRQFNGEIPYLYNKYTQTTFDHKYGYWRVGFSYSF